MVLCAACATDRVRPGEGAPTEPAALETGKVTGSYEASRLLLQREGRVVDLLDDPDTRISLQLNSDGSAQGQLKIGDDPELRTKVNLVGHWRLSVPDRIFFDFTEDAFLEEIGFRVQLPTLSGEWVGDGVRITIELLKQESAEESG